MKFLFDKQKYIVEKNNKKCLKYLIIVLEIFFGANLKPFC